MYAPSHSCVEQCSNTETQVKKLEDEKKLNSPSTRMKNEVSTPPMKGQVHFKGADERVKKLVSDFPTVFSGELGCFKDFKVNIPVPPDATPRFFKPRQPAYSLRERIENDLDRLERQGVYEKVIYSRWAAPIVTVLKNPRDPWPCVDMWGLQGYSQPCSTFRYISRTRGQ